MSAGATHIPSDKRIKRKINNISDKPVAIFFSRYCLLILG